MIPDDEMDEMDSAAWTTDSRVGPMLHRLLDERELLVAEHNSVDLAFAGGFPIAPTELSAAWQAVEDFK